MKVLLLFRIDARESDQSYKYPFLQYMEVTSTIDTVDVALEYVCLRWTADDK